MLNEAAYIVITTLLIGVAGFTAKYLFNKFTKASDLYAKEFVRVDKDIATLRTEMALHCQKNEFDVSRQKEIKEHIEKKLYDHGDKIAVLISRMEKIEHKIEM